MVPKLAVNVDHVATVRQARRTDEPDPVAAAVLAELGGADAIVCHLREDRRHIQDRDLALLKQVVSVRLNLEMGLAPEIVAIARDTHPDQVTFVPERRQELTTEGGLDVAGARDRVRRHVRMFQKQGIEVSLFIDPDPRQIRAARRAGADILEIHTGEYANARDPQERARRLREVEAGVRTARRAGLRVFAGHGLTYRNVVPVARIGGIEELAIGHSIVARAVLVGMERAVREMKALIWEAVHV